MMDKTWWERHDGKRPNFYTCKNRPSQEAPNFYTCKNRPSRVPKLERERRGTQAQDPGKEITDAKTNF